MLLDKGDPTGTITKKTVLPLIEKFKDRVGNPDVKRITEELIPYPEKRHYDRVRSLVPSDQVWLWTVVGE